jgi:hypothetical protein
VKTAVKNEWVLVRCRDCKRVLYAARNDSHVMDTEQYREIGKLALKGGIVDYGTTEEVRKAEFGCRCD